MDFSFIYRNCAWPLLKRTDPEWIHDVTVDLAERTPAVCCGPTLALRPGREGAPDAGRALRPHLPQPPGGGGGIRQGLPGG